MKNMFLKIFSIFSFLILLSCSGGGGGSGGATAANPGTGGGNGGGQVNPPDSTVSYVGYEFSKTQSATKVSGKAADFNTNRTVLGDKALLSVKDLSNYNLSVLIADSECVTDAPNGPLYNKTYAMTLMYSPSGSTKDPTHSVVTIKSENFSGYDIDIVSMASLKSTSDPTSFIVTTDGSGSGTDGGAAFAYTNIYPEWTCHDGGVSKKIITPGIEYVMMANDSAMILKTPEGSVYLGFEVSVLLSNLDVLANKQMTQYSFGNKNGDDYNNCLSICLGVNDNWYASKTGVIYSGSPLVAALPRVGDQTPKVLSASLSTESVVVTDIKYAPLVATTPKFFLLQGTGDTMGASSAHGGRILGLSAKLGDQYISLFSHQFQTNLNKNGIDINIGTVMISVTK